MIMALVAVVNAAEFPATFDATCASFQTASEQCWTDAGNGSGRSTAVDAEVAFGSVCTCMKKFDFAAAITDNTCTTNDKFKYEAYLANSCKMPTALDWTKPALDAEKPEEQNTPCLQSCAKELIKADDECSVAEQCAADVDAQTSCTWEEKVSITALKTKCAPTCFFGTIDALQIKTEPKCDILEKLQPNYHTDTCASAEATAIADRRLACGCKAGFVKSPDSAKCDDIHKLTVQVSLIQDIKSALLTLTKWNTDPISSATGEAAKTYETIFREYIAGVMFPKESLVNAVADVKVNSVVATTVGDIKSEAVSGSSRLRRLAATDGLKVSYTVSKNLSKQTNWEAHGTYAQTAIAEVSAVIEALGFENAMKARLTAKDATVTDIQVARPHAVTSANLANERTLAPTPAPSAAPTVKKDYVQSPSIAFAAAGSIIFLAFVYFCHSHHKPKLHKHAKHPHHEAVASPEKTPNPAAVQMAASPAPAAVASVPAPAPAPSAVVERA